MSKKRGGTEASATEPAGIAWLEALERRVRHAAERLSALAAENRRLRSRLAELERGGGAGAAGESGTAAEAGEWRREREQIRARVERLAKTLEDLLSEPASE